MRGSNTKASNMAMTLTFSSLSTAMVMSHVFSKLPCVPHTSMAFVIILVNLHLRHCHEHVGGTMRLPNAIQSAEAQALVLRLARNMRLEICVHFLRQQKHNATAPSSRTTGEAPKIVFIK